jgi:hypothetical protein
MDIAPENDRTISIDCEYYREVLADKIKALAVFRCQMMLKGRVSEENDVRDQDFTVSWFACALG